MQDSFATFNTGLESPARHGFAVVPSDSEDLPETTRALYVGAAGTVSLVLASGVGVVLSGVPAGTLLPLRATQVRASGTTADAIVGLV